MFSVGLLYSAQEFIRFVHQNRVEAADVRASFSQFGLVRLSDVLELVQLGCWVGLDVDGYFSVTETGLRIASEGSARDQLRLQIKDVALQLRPPWLGLIPRGREEAYLYFPPDVQQCFREASLLVGEDDALISWWDELAEAGYSSRRAAMSEVGREGEKRSIAFEEERTGSRPRWTALYSNNAGYDLLSQVDRKQANPLCIEVKASKQSLVEARLHITANEWRTAVESANYVFHLWLLRDWHEPRAISVGEMARHVPGNKGSGEWELAVVPFTVVNL